MPDRRRLLTAGFTLAASSALAQTPTRPLRAVVPFPPGGGVDAFARAFTLGLAAALGQPVGRERDPAMPEVPTLDATAAPGRLDDLRAGPDQHVGAPDGRHAVLGDGVDLHLDLAGAVEYRRSTAALRACCFHTEA